MKLQLNWNVQSSKFQHLERSQVLWGLVVQKWIARFHQSWIAALLALCGRIEGPIPYTRASKGPPFKAGLFFEAVSLIWKAFRTSK